MAITLTEAAARRVSDHLESRGHGEGLRLGVKTTGCSGLAYVVDFADEIGTEDQVFTSRGVKVIVDGESIKYIDGTEIDFASDGFSTAFRFKNPNVADECGCGESFTVSPPSRSGPPVFAAPEGGLSGLAAVTTLGCKINSFESAAMAQDLARDRWELVDSAEFADVYVINSCTVTAEADRQTRQAVRRALRQNPQAHVIVTGCYAQNQADACAEIPGVSLVLGNDHKHAVARFARNLKKSKRLNDAVIQIDRLTGLPPALLDGFESRSRAFVQVQQGCDQSCTFCVIHRARGPRRSFDEDHILRQIGNFVNAGFCEVVICGVDLGSYVTADAEDGSGLALTSLLKKVTQLPGAFRIRLSSIDPIHLTDDLLAVLSDSDRFCPYLHVSIQSGSTLILKRMKRRYDREFLKDRLDAARQHIDGLVLGADVMAGFPTESEQDFADTVDIVDRSKGHDAEGQRTPLF